MGISFKQPTHQSPVVDENGKMDKNWFRWLLDFSQSVQFFAVSTAGGNVNFPMPIASKNQGVTVIVKKSTGDANTVTPVASGTDTLDNVGVNPPPLTTGNPVARYISDGVSTWHLV